MGSKAKDVYESKISLASRIVKVERAVSPHFCLHNLLPILSVSQVEDIETKLDQLLEMYMEDRARMSAASLSAGAQVFPSHTASSLANRSPPPPPPSTPAFSGDSGIPSYIKSKPLLVEKQSSEPNTPIARSFDKQMTRGNSDLSQRLAKKRVTLRHSLDTTANRCSSAGTQRTAAEVQRSARSDSSIGGITLSSATASAPAIKLETDIEANPTNAQNDSQTTLISSVDSLEPEVLSEAISESLSEVVSEASTLGTDVESLRTPDQTASTLTSEAKDWQKGSHLAFTDQPFSVSSTFDAPVDHSQIIGRELHGIVRDSTDRLTEISDFGNESDCDSTQTTVIHRDSQSLLRPMSPMPAVSSVVSSDSTLSARLHPKYHHHPHHSHHHSHHPFKTAHHSTDNL